MSYQTVAQVPSSKETLPLKWLSMVRESLEGTSNQKFPGVSISMPSSLLWGIALKGGCWGMLQYEEVYCAHFLKIQFGISHDAGQMSFKAASHNPPKWGALLGIKCQSMPWLELKSHTTALIFWERRNSYSSFNEWLAPTKLVPWSLHIDVGLPLLAMNRLRQARNASVVRSETTSKCTALTDIETNT